MTVKYSRAFPIAAYGINEHIGFEVEIDDTVDIQIALQKLREQAEQSFTTAHPNVVLTTPIEQTLTKEQITEGNLKAINDCTTLQELESYKLLTKQGKLEFDAYNAKKQALTR